MQTAAEETEIVVKRISASEYEVYSAAPAPKAGTEAPKREEPAVVPPRESVIQRAPPRSAKPEDPPPPAKKRKMEEGGGGTGVILIKDAIMYRIVDILMWKVMGETKLKSFGYPAAPTHQVLWRIVRQNCLPSGTKQLPQDHDCAGNVSCFAGHVYQFLEICAPNLWRRTGWGKLSIEEVLRRIYYEDLIPFLKSIDLRNNFNVLQCHSDIVLLEKWEKQKFTAVTWSAQKYISQTSSVNCPRCPQCSNRHF